MAQADARSARWLWDAFGAARRESAPHADELRNDLLLHYLPLVETCARRLAARLPAEVDVEDLQIEGVLGLMDAIDQFDPGRGIKFETFAPRRIYGAMLD